MRGQHQRIDWQFGKAVDGTQEQIKGVAFRFVWPDADVRADLGQQHVTGYQHAERLAVQCGMFRGVAIANDDAPRVSAHVNLISIEHAHEAARGFRYDFSVRVPSAGNVPDALRVEAV